MPLENSEAFFVRAGKNVPGNMTSLIDAMVLYQNATGARTNELYIVYKECQHWCRKHVNSVFAITKSMREESAVNWLMVQVIQELNTSEAGLGTAFEKYEVSTAGGRAVAGVTKLEKGYRFERKTYADDKTTMPYSGSPIRDLAQGTQNRAAIDFHGI